MKRRSEKKEESHRMGDEVPNEEDAGDPALGADDSARVVEVRAPFRRETPLGPRSTGGGVARPVPRSGAATAFAPMRSQEKKRVRFLLCAARALGENSGISRLEQQLGAAARLLLFAMCAPQVRRRRPPPTAAGARRVSQGSGSVPLQQSAERGA